MSNPIRFKSVLNPDKWGFEFTGDSMTFWDSSYHHGGVVHCSLGYYETLGDGTTQHTPLRPCRNEQFTDVLLSFVRHVIENPKEEIEGIGFLFDEVPEKTIRFLSGISFSDEKYKWFNVQECKISTHTSKDHDKRWFKVPSWADGTIASAVGLYGMVKNDWQREILNRYRIHQLFSETLYGVVNQGHEEWEKITSYQTELPGDHNGAIRAFLELLKSRQSLQWAIRSADCAQHNSTLTKVAA